MINKKILSRYATKEINSNFYGKIKIDEIETNKILTEEQVKNGEQGYFYAPWTTIITHAEIWDENGKTKRIRQVSYWVLFKLWLNKLIYGTFKLKNNNKKGLY